MRPLRRAAAGILPRAPARETSPVWYVGPLTAAEETPCRTARPMPSADDQGSRADDRRADPSLLRRSRHAVDWSDHLRRVRPGVARALPARGGPDPGRPR